MKLFKHFTPAEYTAAGKLGLDLNDWKDYVKFREMEEKK